ncbi:shikimate kinase [Nitratifractor sp.]|uniref:shikimate kinase n=1 Tax=Nitratifractor sp. TaxID=2268144 RepID=UPI002600458D|nr:shikimate kinase [Nitratifractor sp.]
MKKNIILIGFMGVGKGTTARAYAKRYGVYNIDTDDLIESKENRSIPKIFKKKGEAYFRRLEQETADWIECCVDGTLVSCGGGFYQVDNLKKLGTVVLLHASFDWIHHRLSSAKNAEKKLAKRPLFSDPKKAKKLYREREKAYRKIADLIVDVEGKNMEEILEEIHAGCEKRFSLSKESK